MEFLGEILVWFVVAMLAWLLIGLPLHLFRRWRDKTNAPVANEELNYIELSRRQKQDGWTFQQRYRFLEQKGLRKNNIDAVLGQVERYEQVTVTDEEFEKEYNEILSGSDHLRRDEILLRTYAGFRDGLLKHLPLLYTVQEAKAKRLKQFVTFYRNLYGRALEWCLTQRPFQEDEILVAVDAEWFLLTSQALYLFRKKKTWSLIRILPLAEISRYSVRGWWTFQMDIQLRSGEQVVLRSLEKVPREEVMRALLDAPAGTGTA